MYMSDFESDFEFSIVEILTLCQHCGCQRKICRPDMDMDTSTKVDLYSVQISPEEPSTARVHPPHYYWCYRVVIMICSSTELIVDFPLGKRGCFHSFGLP